MVALGLKIRNIAYAPPWASAMAQGEIISLFLRYYQLTGEKNISNIQKRLTDF